MGSIPRGATMNLLDHVSEEEFVALFKEFGISYSEHTERFARYLYLTITHLDLNITNPSEFRNVFVGMGQGWSLRSVITSTLFQHWIDDPDKEEEPPQLEGFYLVQRGYYQITDTLFKRLVGLYNHNKQKAQNLAV